MIRLFTSSFLCPSASRRDEYALAMRRNIDCSSLDGIFVFDEGSNDLPSGNPRLTVRRVTSRPTYADYFAWINELAENDDVSIVANADIYFDNQIELLNRWVLPDNVVIALSRWDKDKTGRMTLRDRNDSQDSWILRGRVGNVYATFPVGIPRCDNRIVSELRKSGLAVLNPSFSLRSYHLHDGDRTSYGETVAGYVEPPYEYVWPTNLWSLPRTTFYNIRYPYERLSWRLDRRMWASRLKLHWFSKVADVLRPKSQ